MQLSLVCFVYTQGSIINMHPNICTHYVYPAQSPDCNHADHSVGIELRSLTAHFFAQRLLFRHPRFRGLLRYSFLFFFVVLGLVKVRFCLFWIRSGKKNMSIFKSGSPRSLTVVDDVSWVFPMKRCLHYIYILFFPNQTNNPSIHTLWHPFGTPPKRLKPITIVCASGRCCIRIVFERPRDPGSGGWNDATREVSEPRCESIDIDFWFQINWCKWWLVFELIVWWW